jgi:hypothetical protein
MQPGGFRLDDLRDLVGVAPVRPGTQIRGQERVLAIGQRVARLVEEEVDAQRGSPSISSIR